MTVPEALREVLDLLRDVHWNLGDDYRTVPVDRLLDSEVAVCWDFVNFQHREFQRLGLDDSSYLLIYEMGDGESLSHTWSMVRDGGCLWWFESSWGGHEGIRPTGSPLDVARELMESNPPKSPALLYEYDPEGLDLSLTPDEFVSAVKSRGVEIPLRPENRPTTSGVGVASTGGSVEDRKGSGTMAENVIEQVEATESMTSADAKVETVFTEEPIVMGPGEGVNPVTGEVVGEVGEATPKSEVEALAREIFELGRKIDELTAKKKEVSERVLKMVGPGVKMHFDVGNGLNLTTVEASVQNRFDSAKFKRDDEETYNRYLKQVNVKAYVKVSEDKPGKQSKKR